MKSKGFTKNLYSLKYSLREFLVRNKFKIIFCVLFCVIGLLTGIFTAVKIMGLDEEEIFESFNLTYQLEDLEKFSANFFTRLLSYELVLILLMIFSLHPALYLFGWCLLAYRAFLISINCMMIILWFSFNGIIKALLILLPCQLLMLFIMIAFFCYACSQIRNCKYQKKKIFSVLFPLLLASLALTLINLLETILLFIFRSDVILVI
mgnify:CR=1 FL=1